MNFDAYQTDSTFFNPNLTLSCTFSIYNSLRALRFLVAHLQDLRNGCRTQAPCHRKLVPLQPLNTILSRRSVLTRADHGRRKEQKQGLRQATTHESHVC